MKVKTWFIAGIIGAAVVAGIFEALSSPRKKREPEEKKEEVRAKTPQ